MKSTAPGCILPNVNGVLRTSAPGGKDEKKNEFTLPVGSDSNITIRVASSIRDRCKAWALVNRVYRAKGYLKNADQDLWYSLHDALQDTITFLGECDGQPIAALTLVFDSPLKLPADGCFEEKLDAFRKHGRRLCEIVSLVNIEANRGRELVVTRELFGLVYWTALKLKAFTDLTIVVNPKHAPFYERFFLFERLSEEIRYGRVGGAPGVLLRLNLNTAERRLRASALESGRNRYMRYIVESNSEALVEWVRRNQRPLDESSFRRYFVDRLPLIWKAPARHREFLEEQYFARGPRKAVVQ